MGEVSTNMESKKILKKIFRLFSKVQNDRYRDFSLTLKMTKKESQNNNVFYHTHSPACHTNPLGKYLKI
ncbi:hypothetical protein [Helicobacter bilis]|uniref:hypothetical protein n=1 Tax=Helicobacter bilis TaxID=37372 RepID=UPI0013154EF1|nr:hypothetical protein [Helicobacter bilis]